MMILNATPCEIHRHHPTVKHERSGKNRAQNPGFSLWGNR